MVSVQQIFDSNPAYTSNSSDSDIARLWVQIEMIRQVPGLAETLLPQLHTGLHKVLQTRNYDSSTGSLLGVLIACTAEHCEDEQIEHLVDLLADIPELAGYVGYLQGIVKLFEKAVQR